MNNTTQKIIRESQLFEFYASHIWPIHRLFAKKMITPRCKKCVISSKASTLDKDGVCSLCKEKTADQVYKISKETQEQLENELASVFHEYTGKGESYDALVMISGGKDSALLLHELTTKFPLLRLLTVTIDNSFMSPVALNNVTNILERFSLPHITYRPDPRIFEKAFSYAFTHPNGLGCAQTVDTIDGELFLDAGRDIAGRYKIPLLITGFSFEQVDRYLHWSSFRNQEYDAQKRTTAGIYTIDELTDPQLENIWWDPAKYSNVVPQLICPFYVWRWNEIEIEEKLDELKLIDKKHSSPLVTNNALIPLCGLVDIARLGYSSWEPEFSRMVREGKTDAGVWRNIFELIEYSYKTGRFISDSVDGVLQRLKLTRKDVNL